MRSVLASGAYSVLPCAHFAATVGLPMALLGTLYWNRFRVTLGDQVFAARWSLLYEVRVRDPCTPGCRYETLAGRSA